MDEIKKVMKGALEDRLPVGERDELIRSKGAFMLLSSEDLSPSEVLPLYYARQSVEQVFDLQKNNLELLPIRVHGEETFRGHLMLTFMASAALITARNALKSCGGTEEVFHFMRNLKCKVYDDKVLVKEPTRKMSDVAKLLGFEPNFDT